MYSNTCKTRQKLNIKKDSKLDYRMAFSTIIRKDSPIMSFWYNDKLSTKLKGSRNRYYMKNSKNCLERVATQNASPCKTNFQVISTVINFHIFSKTITPDL